MVEIMKKGLNEEETELVEKTLKKACDIDPIIRLLNQLTDHEVEVLWDLLSDLPLKAIAVKRNISKRTVQLRKKRLLQLFGCKSLLELAAYFASQGVTGVFNHDFFGRFRSMRQERVG